MNYPKRLQTLVDQIDDLAGARIVYIPGKGYWLREADKLESFLDGFAAAERFLKDWIAFGHHPAIIPLSPPSGDPKPIQRSGGAARARKPKQGQQVVGVDGFTALLHESPLGRSWSTVKVDSVAFKAWLADHVSFTVDLPGLSFVVRNEKRRGESGWWYAYWKDIERKVHKRYVGKTEAITWAKLLTVYDHFHEIKSPAIHNFGRA